MSLFVVSNRLPIVLKREADKKLSVSPGAGGLITALAPPLRSKGGKWVGWAGIADLTNAELKPVVKQASKQNGFEIEAVPLTAEDVDGYYNGFSNEVIWPLFHDLQSHCNFVPEYWDHYQNVNAKFAAAIKKSCKAEDFIWVHDYQLMLLGQELRKEQVKNKTGFFLHIPFPPLDIFLKLPWRFQIIRALLEYDLVGFQTMRDKRNFIQCVRTLLKDVRFESSKAMHVLKVGSREVRVGCFPISIDFDEFERLAQTEEVAKQAWIIHERLPERKLILCVDRLDYTKGITYRLEAFKMLLQNYPKLCGQVSLVQIVVPSRTNIPKYRDLKNSIDKQVSEINSLFTHEGWIPIHYLYRSLTRKELLAYYRTSEIAFVTPIKDGMNLVAKEYVASNIEENGVLILSEFAGAVAQLHEDALLVNPYDVLGMAEALYQAYTMSDEERYERMRRMRSQVKRHDIYKWVRSFLHAATSDELVAYSHPKEFIPDDETHSSLDQELVSL